MNRRAGAALRHRRGILVDAGAGTGLPYGERPADATYLAVDLDAAKLRRLLERTPGTIVAFGDVTALPVATASCQTVLIKAVTHHLMAPDLEAFLSEAARILQVGGRLVLLDAVRAPERWPARVLWALDRGSHPYSAEELRAAVERRFRVVDWQIWTLLHRYVIVVGEPLPA